MARVAVPRQLCDPGQDRVRSRRRSADGPSTATRCPVSVAAREVANRPAVLVIPVPPPRPGTHRDGLPAGSALHDLRRHDQIIAHLFDSDPTSGRGLTHSAQPVSSAFSGSSFAWVVGLEPFQVLRGAAVGLLRVLLDFGPFDPPIGCGRRSGSPVGHRCERARKSGSPRSARSRLLGTSAGNAARSTLRSRPHPAHPDDRPTLKLALAWAFVPMPEIHPQSGGARWRPPRRSTQ